MDVGFERKSLPLQKIRSKTTMALKLYPIGIQTFERIRKEDKLYIDNTQYCVTKVGINFDYTQGNITD